MLKPPVQPMLLTSKEKPFDDEDYIYEIKWDGYRVIIFLNNNDIYIQSRNNNDLTSYFPELKQISSLIHAKQVVLDGELCYLNQEGKSVFEKLLGRISQKYEKNKSIKYPVTLIVWDILSLNENDIFDLPLMERKKYLKDTLTNGAHLQKTQYIKQYGKKLYQAVKAENLEGIVAKKANSPYEFKRSLFWYKIKIWQYTQTYISGYTRDRMSFIVGKYNDNHFINMGKVKINLGENEYSAIFNILPDLKIDSEKSNLNIIYVKPLIKCQIKYTEISSKNTFRHGFAVSLVIDE